MEKVKLTIDGQEVVKALEQHADRLLDWAAAKHSKSTNGRGNASGGSTAMTMMTATLSTLVDPMVRTWL